MAPNNMTSFLEWKKGRHIPCLFQMLLVFLMISSFFSGIDAGNLALRQPTASSSVWGNVAPSERAADGYPTSVCLHSTSSGNKFYCSMSNPETNPWWRVDLGKSYVVDSVYIIARTDTDLQRHKGLEIRIGDSLVDNGASNPLCGSVPSISAPLNKVFYCHPALRGRYVSLHVPGDSKRLEVCEVQVNNNPTTNIARSKTTSQSSTSASGYSSRAVDGNQMGAYFVGSCTHTYSGTGGSANPWWRVDLGSSQPISEVFLVNRDGATERLTNIEIRVGDSLSDNGNTNPRCGGVYSMAGIFKESFYCKPRKTGRYVNIRLVGSNMMLTLCEVQVYSESKAILRDKPPTPTVVDIFDLEVSPVNLTCPEPYGYPVPYVAWVRNRTVYQNSTVLTRFTTPPLDSREDGVVWECLVSNKHGADFHQFVVKLQSHNKICNSYQTLPSGNRYPTHVISGSSQATNDSSINDTVWIRFVDNYNGLLQLPESCVPIKHCGTQAPGWLLGSHPGVREGVVRRTACFKWNGNCCRYRTEILVRRCFGYYIYKLQRAAFDVPAGYCAVPSHVTDKEQLMTQLTHPHHHTLEGHVVFTERDVTAFECVTFCMTDRRCASANYNKETRVCELNNSTRHAHPGDFRQKSEASEYFGPVSYTITHYAP